MVSRRQRARARRTALFWAEKLDRALTAHDRAKVRYDQARAAVHDLSPADRADACARVEAVLEQLHGRWADERAVKLWRRHLDAARQPRDRLLQAWRLLWAVVETLDEPDAAWQVAENELASLTVTLGDNSAGPNSTGAERSGAGPTRRRAPAPAPPRREEQRTRDRPEFDPKTTLRNQNHGRTAG